MQITKRLLYIVAVLLLLQVGVRTLAADPFSFSTGTPNGAVATGSRPSTGGVLEIESADDFILSSATAITAASFYGLVPDGATVDQVVLEIYRVFPLDSTDPPSGNVPTRMNSPSDVAFASRDSDSSELTYSVTSLGSFSAGNSVLNGIHKKPDQTTLGEGPVSGQEILVSALLNTPFTLPTDHYFFIPQVKLSTGDFLWLSGQRPTTPPFMPDLQSWIRNEDLSPDWLRVGTDVIGTGTFNGAFSLEGSTVPEPSSVLLGLSGLAGLWLARRKRTS